MKIKVSKLLFDYNLYPRHKIDPYHVNSMAESLRAGAEMPPVLVDRKSNRVVDGFHRVSAYRKVYGPNVKIPAILKEWPDEASILEEAGILNASHGRALTTYDKVRYIALAETVHLEPERIASALNIRLERVEELKMERLAGYCLESVALKRTTSHLAGYELTDKQVAYNTKAGGLHQTFYINQVIAMLESDTVNWGNERTVKSLGKLYELLEKVMTVKV